MAKALGGVRAGGGGEARGGGDQRGLGAARHSGDGRLALPTILASGRKTDVCLFSFQQENRPTNRLTFEIRNNCDGKLEPLEHNEAEAGVRNGCPDRALSSTTGKRAEKMLAQPPKKSYTHDFRRETEV